MNAPAFTPSERESRCGFVSANLLHRPQRQRRRILHHHPFARQRRMRPGCAVGHGVAFDRLQAFGRRARDFQGGIGVERVDQAARRQHGGVFALARVARPNHFAGIGVEAKVLAFVFV